MQETSKKGNQVKENKGTMQHMAVIYALLFVAEDFVSVIISTLQAMIVTSMESGRNLFSYKITETAGSLFLDLMVYCNCYALYA